jgi:hypothetical protein
VRNFLAILSSIDWTPFYTSHSDIDTKCDFLHDTLSDMVKQCIPKKSVPMNERDKPWMTPLLKHAIQMRWNAYRNKDFPMYHHWKQKVKVMITKAKQKWSSKAKNSSKDLWNVVRSETGTKNKNSIYAMTKSFDSVTAAVNKINEKFSSVFVSSAINPVITTEDGHWNINITVSLVERKFSAIDPGKSMGSDEIPSLLYKRGAKYLAGPFIHLFNMSINECRFPKRWKHSYVCPIPKSVPPDINNLRPISLLPVPAKIFERIVLQTVHKAFISSFGNNQYGCRPSSSTTCAVIALRHHALTALESSKVSGIKIVAYDFTKAFDKLSHGLILEKLTRLKFPATFIQWTGSYLRDRTQATRIGSTVSSPTEVVSGVPQGSVLGPMFFCMIVGDFAPLHDGTKIIQYVDDTTICIPLYNNEANFHVAKEHDRILSWAAENGLIVNSKKCLSLFYAKSQNAKDIQLYDVPSTNEIKFLGVVLNNRLTWSSHIQHICRQASRRFYALRILRPILTVQELVGVYNGIVRSVLEYASPAFGNLPGNLEDELEKIQRRCHRLICRVPRSSQCRCNLFPRLSVRRNTISAKLFKSAVSNKSHILHNIMPAKSSRSTRFILPQLSTSRFLHSFIPHTAILINSSTN